MNKIKNKWYAKLKRFVTAILPVERGKEGNCSYRECGAVCCKLPIKCIFLKNDLSCMIYKFRPLNCRKFPRTRDDLMLVRDRCSFKFRGM